MRVSKIDTAVTNYEQKLNELIEALAAAGIIATSKENSVMSIVDQAKAADDDGSQAVAGRQRITKAMVQGLLSQPSVQQENITDPFALDLFDNGMYYVNTGPSAIGGDDTNPPLASQERDILHDMVAEWNTYFSANTITTVQFITAYATIESQYLNTNDPRSNQKIGYIQLIDQ